VANLKNRKSLEHVIIFSWEGGRRPWTVGGGAELAAWTIQPCAGSAWQNPNWRQFYQSGLLDTQIKKDWTGALFETVGIEKNLGKRDSVSARQGKAIGVWLCREEASTTDASSAFLRYWKYPWKDISLLVCGSRSNPGKVFGKARKMRNSRGPSKSMETDRLEILKAWMRKFYV
jgi:hypothetical protein